MPEWENEYYKHLLRPSIFSVRLINIRKTIELLKEYGIDKYITNNSLRRNVTLQRKLIEYLLEQDISLVIERNGNYVLNPILNANNTNLKINNSEYGKTFIKTLK